MFANFAKLLPVAAVAACNEIPSITHEIKNEPPPAISQLLKNIEHNRESKIQTLELKRRTTSIGRLAHLTSTESNPSIVSFFITLSSPPSATGLSSSSFSETFASRILTSPRYSRFASTLSADSQTFTEKDVEETLKSLVTNTIPPTSRLETARIIESMIYAPLPKSKSGEPYLWSARVSTGEVSASSPGPGFNSKSASDAIQNGRTEESYIFFKASHILGDGVSLGNVLIDLSDEAPELNQKIKDVVKKRRRGGKKKSVVQKLLRAFKKLTWFIFGCFKFFEHQFLLTLENNRNPFDSIIRSAKPQNRTLSWTTSPIPLTTLKKICGFYNCTVNDIFVTCVSLAVKRQLRELKGGKDVGGKIGVVIPVHLQGGVLLEGQSIGNRIGAVNASVDVSSSSRTTSLANGKTSLQVLKTTPAPLISYLMAKMITLPIVPTLVARMGLKFGIGGSCVAISNVRGPESKLHIDGRTVENVVGFVPPPPGVPIGVVVQSYNGGVCLSVNGDGRCVPDGDKFLGWVLQELAGYVEEVNSTIIEE